jgi:PKD repeat protein
MTPKLLFSSLIVLLLLSSCKKVADSITPSNNTPVPTVSFSISANGYGIYQFYVSATNADSYSWDFGDGYTSSEASPIHAYKANATYTISVTAKGRGGSSIATKSLNVSSVAGTATFWMSSGSYNVDVTVDNKYLATITNNYSNAPSCEAAGTASFSFLSEGSHSFTAKEKGRLIPRTWNGSIVIIGGNCSKMQLTI